MKRLRSPLKKDEATEMPKRSRMQDKMLAMIGGSSEPPKKQPKKDTQKESSETVGKGKKNLLNIPLREFSPEVRKMLVAGMVKGGKARVVKVKKTKGDKKSKEKK